jgi:site-specific recombinase XerD
MVAVSTRTVTQPAFLPLSASPAIEPGYHAGRRPANAGKRLPPEVFLPREIGALMKACSPRAPTGIRNRALLIVGYRTGARISELLALAPNDVDEDQSTVRILRGKGGRWRAIGMDPGGFAVLQRWMDRRERLNLPRGAPLFCTLAGGAIDPSYIRHLLPRLAKKAGIDKRVHSHGLRHTLATEMFREDKPLWVIQGQLGHARPSTTDRYLRSAHQRDVVEAVRDRSWPLELE